MIVWLGVPLAALLTTTSSRPNSSTARSTSRRHCATSPVSVGTASARAPSCLELGDDLVEVLGPPGRDHDVAPVARRARARSTGRCPGPTPVTTATRPGGAHGRAAPKSSAMRASRRASSASSSARQPASASAAASTDAARNRR